MAGFRATPSMKRAGLGPSRIRRSWWHLGFAISLSGAALLLAVKLANSIGRLVHYTVRSRLPARKMEPRTGKPLAGFRAVFHLSTFQSNGTSIIGVKKTTAWGESGFPSEFLGIWPRCASPGQCGFAAPSAPGSVPSSGRMLGVPPSWLRPVLVSALPAPSAFWPLAWPSVTSLLSVCSSWGGALPCCWVPATRG